MCKYKTRLPLQAILTMIRKAPSKLDEHGIASKKNTVTQLR